MPSLIVGGSVAESTLFEAALSSYFWQDARITQPPGTESTEPPACCERQNPRLCRGGSSSLTYPRVDLGLRLTDMHV